MIAEARITPIWKKQKLFVGIFMLALGAWFFLDGLRNYPRSNQRWTAYEKFKTEERLSEWPAYAKSRGWVATPPHKFYQPQDIGGQYLFGTLGALLGTGILIFWATQIRRTLKIDEEAVYTPAGTRVPFAAITGIGKKQWDSKGIAKVRYDADGRTREFVIDDYKFEAEPTHGILAEIEQRLLARSGVEEEPPLEN